MASHLVFNYGSYTEVVAAAMEPPVCEGNRKTWEDDVNGHDNGDNGDNGAQWYGWNNTAVPSIAKLSDFFLVKGWPEGVKKMREKMKLADVPQVVSVRRRQVWADQGTELSRDRLYAGHDAFWRGRAKLAINTVQRIRIVASTGVTAHARSEDMFWLGASVITLAESLIKAGHEVEIIANASARYGEDTYSMTTVVKAFDQPFNYATTLAITGHASFHRQVVFCHRASKTDTVWYGRGSTVHASVEPVDSLGVRQIGVTHMTSAEQANAWVAATIASLGVADAA